MIRLRINARGLERAKTWFFDRPRVALAMDEARKTTLNRTGALVMRTARNSIKRPRRWKFSELSEDDQNIYLFRVAKAKREGEPKPLLPFRTSPPGTPPFNQTGLLKNFILYFYDRETKSVVIGPVRLPRFPDKNICRNLEFGGKTIEGNTIEPRPYMRPANEKVRTKYLELWRDAMRRS